MKEVKIWADGSCAGNPGVGGYCAILQYKEVKKVIKGSCTKTTTNNRMELTAILEGLRALKEQVKVTIFTDSGYVVDAMNKGYLKSWINNGWRTKKGTAVKNIDLWKAIWEETQKHDCTFTWVEGHASNDNNNACDVIAKSMIKRVQNTTTVDYA